MTEIPEHLLARSKARRAGRPSADGEHRGVRTDAGRGRDAGAAPAAAAGAGRERLPAARAGRHQGPRPDPPYVAAASSRARRSPTGPCPVLAACRSGRSSTPAPRAAAFGERRPDSAEGTSLRQQCATCHGGDRRGRRRAPAQRGRRARDVPRPRRDHVRWVHGSARSRRSGGPTATPTGAGGRTSPPRQGCMPASGIDGARRARRRLLRANSALGGSDGRGRGRGSSPRRREISRALRREGLGAPKTEAKADHRVQTRRPTDRRGQLIRRLGETDPVPRRTATTSSSSAAGPRAPRPPTGWRRAGHDVVFVEKKPFPARRPAATG